MGTLIIGGKVPMKRCIVCSEELNENQKKFCCKECKKVYEKLKKDKKWDQTFELLKSIETLERFFKTEQDIDPEVVEIMAEYLKNLE